MKRFLGYIGAALAVLFIVVQTVPASALSSGLSITPRKDYTIRPGQSVTDKLNITNLNSAEDLQVAIRVIDFSFMDESGTPKLMLADNAQNTTWSLKPFTKLGDTVIIPKGQTRSVPITITIPENQGAGSYYSAIQYQATGVGGGNVSLSAAGVSLAFVSVPGIVHEDLRLKTFGAYLPDAQGVSGRFLTWAIGVSPTKMAYTLKNNGNVAESPTGTVVIRDMFGHDFTTIKNANPIKSLALIDQTRRFEACIVSKEGKITLEGTTTNSTSCVDPKLKPGRYTAALDVFYGQNGNQTKEITASATFWYLPWWFIAAVGAGLLIIIGAIWWIIRKIVRAKRGGKGRLGRH